VSLATRKALYQKLTGTSAVTTKLATNTSVFHGQAPPDAAYPFIIIGKQGKSRDRAFAKTTAFENEIWMVKAVDRNSTSNRAEEISEAVQAALTNGTLTVTGRTVEDIYPTGDVDFLEVDGDQTFRHHGTMYRIVTT
jgi:spore maturation protein CgeB